MKPNKAPGPDGFQLNSIRNVDISLKTILFFLEKEDDPRPLHLGDAYGHFIDYSRGPYKVLQQSA